MESFTLAGGYSYDGRKFSRPVTVSAKGVARDEVDGGILCNANSIKGRISFFFVACCRLYIIFNMYRYIINAFLPQNLFRAELTSTCSLTTTVVNDHAFSINVIIMQQ